MSVNKERAWDVLQKLSFERVTGTAEEKRAAEMLLEECQKANVEAHLESYPIVGSKINEVSFEVLKPVYKKINCIGVGKTASTPIEGITGGFVYCDSMSDTNIARTKGKFALVQGNVGKKEREKLVKAGCLGTILIHGDLYEDESLINELRPRDDRSNLENNIPGIVIHITDAEELVKMKPEEVKVVLVEENDVELTSQNVVATIEGTDLKDEIVTFSAHYDSVRYSKGAWDNMTGSITILELLHYYAENRPRRTVKFVWCGSEEIGLVGSHNYCESHKEEMEKTIVNINFDMTGVTLGADLCCVSASNDTKSIVDYVAKINNFPLNVNLGVYSSDSTSFAMAGVPAMSFARMQTRGGKQFHNHYDEMSHLDADTFMETLNFVVKFSSEVINAPVNVIERSIDQSLEKKFEERRAFYASMKKAEDK